MGTTDSNGVYTPDLDEEGWDPELATNFDLFSQNITDLADLKDSSALNVMDAPYGAVNNGTGDQGGALNAAFAAATGPVIIPPGVYLCSTQPFLNRNDLAVWAPGATIKTTGSISGLKITGFRNKIYGLSIDHSGNASAPCGFEMVGVSARNRFYDCNVFGDSSLNATYAAWYLRNGTPGNNNTGPFWTRLIGCGTQSLGGAKPFAYGILLEGTANHTIIDGGTYSDLVTMLRIRDQTGDAAHAIPNAVRMYGAAVESCTTVCHVSGTAASNILGPILSFNRLESITTMLSLTGITTQPSVPPSLLFNDYAQPTITTYINNPNGLTVNALDPSITPDLGAESMKLWTYANPLKLARLDLDDGALRIRAGGNTIGTISAAGSLLTINDTAGNGIQFTGSRLGFYGAAPDVKPTITGDRLGNTALGDLLTDLASRGLLTDSTTDSGAGSGAPTTADYLVGTTQAGLSAEIVVGATPGGELGGTWASPTVDATHSGSAHHAAATEGTGIDISGQVISVDLSEISSGGELGGTMDAPTVDATHSGSTHAATQAAAEATAAAANTADIATHAGLADPHTGYQKETEKAAASGYASLDGSTKVPVAQLPTGTSSSTVALGDAAAALDATHAGAADPHTGYRLESVTIGTSDITDDAVTYAKMQNVSATSRVLGRVTAGAGNTEELTGTQVASLLPSKVIGTLTATGGAISTTETVMLSGTIPANTLAAGDTFFIRAQGYGTTGVTPGTGTWVARIGPTTLTGASTVSTGALTLVASRTTKPWIYQAMVQVFTIGAAGTAQGSVFIEGRKTTNDLITESVTNPMMGTVGTPAAVDTTVDNLLELTFVSTQAGSSCLIMNGIIQKA